MSDRSAPDPDDEKPAAKRGGRFRAIGQRIADAISAIFGAMPGA